MTEPGRLGPPIDPLSEVAWARIERGLWAALDAEPATTIFAPPRQRRWMWIAAPALAMAALVFFVVFTRDGSPAAEPARVVAGATPSSISFGDAHVALDANSIVVVDANQALLERGAAWFTITPRGSRPAFLVLAGDATVRVVGTRFRVARNDERVAVTVDHGLVEVQFQGTQLRVGANQTWTSEHPTTVAPSATTAQVSLETPHTAPDPSPPVTSTVAPDRHPDVPKHHVEAIHHDIPHATKLESTTDPDEIQFHKLERLEPSNPNAAIKGYLKLAQGNGPWVENALYAAGRTAYDFHDPRAASLLSIYVQRFPNGRNVVDARHLLVLTRGEHR
jgi:hypothetical protein